jgi:hypothetical protein
MSIINLKKELLGETKFTKEELHENFERIYREARLIFGK